MVSALGCGVMHILTCCSALWLFVVLFIVHGNLLLMLIELKVLYSLRTFLQKLKHCVYACMI